MNINFKSLGFGLLAGFGLVLFFMGVYFFAYLNRDFGLETIIFYCVPYLSFLIFGIMLFFYSLKRIRCIENKNTNTYDNEEENMEKSERVFLKFFLIVTKTIGIITAVISLGGFLMLNGLAGRFYFTSLMYLIPMAIGFGTFYFSRKYYRNLK